MAQRPAGVIELTLAYGDDELDRKMQVVSSNEIHLEIVDGGMQVDESVAFAYVDDEEERRRKLSLNQWE